MSRKAPTPHTVVEENYVKFQHEFLEFLYAHLVDMRVIFEGDLDALLIFISISRYYLRDERANPDMDEEALGDNRHLTLSRIAELTGIPRETARRKLRQLESKGLLEKGQHDNWRLVVQDGQPVIRTKYEPVWQRVMQRLVKLVRTLRADV
jgi:predicted transcriptional regulator